MTALKLTGEFKNAPKDTSLVPCSANDGLNREETLSGRRKVLPVNSGEENRPPITEGQDLRVPVFVVSMRGRPLMPSTPRKARTLLRNNRAKVIKRSPFTIQLDYPTGEVTQPITLGLDSGYAAIGFSALTTKEELLAGEVTLRKDVSKKLTERRMYRTNRRSRLWYRPPRFNNRIGSKKKGWLPPSIKHKLDTHVRLVEVIKKLLPITEVIVEVATFDSHKMVNPEVTGVEYQQGTLHGYEVKEYLLEKWGRKCAYCDKENIPLEVEHIVPKIRGGTNRVDNLTLACTNCNQKKGNLTAAEFGYLSLQEQAKKTLRAPAFMNSVRWQLVDQLNCQHTFGYLTKQQRFKQQLSKSHRNDAFIIAGGDSTQHCRARPFNVPQIRRNNRCLQLNRKGFKLSVRKQRYPFQPNDLVRLKMDPSWQLYRVRGTHCKGKRVIIYPATNPPGNRGSKSIKQLELVRHGKGLSFDYIQD